MTDKQPTGRLLINAFRRFETELLARLAANGIGDITLSHLNVLRHLDPTGLRLTELAAEAGLTKQAVGKIANELVTKGYLSIQADPDDARAKRIVYTEKGQHLIQTSVDIVGEMEGDYVKVLGESGYNTLRQLLVTLIKNHPRGNNDALPTRR